MFPIEITTQPRRRMAGATHIGPYLEIGTAFQKIASVFSARNLWGEARGMAGIYFDDPSLIAPDKLRSGAGILVGDDFAIPDALQEMYLPGGRLAVMHFKGPYAGLPAAYDYLFGQYLPQSGKEPRDAPAFEVYLNDPTNTAPDDLLTDVCIPIV